jgi:hypothetical protein
VNGFRVFALDDTGRDVELPNDPTEETTMQPSALAMAVGALCRPGGLTPENQRRVEEAILAPRTVDRSAADAFHDHLDVCKQCRENPFSLCRVGLPLLTATMAKPAPRLSPEAEREQAIRLAREAYEAAREKRQAAGREETEREIAWRELTGESPIYLALLRAQLWGTPAEYRACQVEFWADISAAGRDLRAMPDDLRADVAERAAAMKTEREH